jgi:hypothetical protein
MKLVSGMLTYDQGNADRVVSGPRRKLYDDGSVQVYDRPDAQSSPSGDRSAAQSSPSGDRMGAYPGTDGHIYRATPQPALPDGVQLIRKPIATTVNGQPSLVAERGPEIIIGRRATRHIQMNEPGLLHHLAAINGRYRTYDQGTVPAAAVPLASPSGKATAPSGSPAGKIPKSDCARAVQAELWRLKLPTTSFATLFHILGFDYSGEDGTAATVKHESTTPTFFIYGDRYYVAMSHPSRHDCFTAITQADYHQAMLAAKQAQRDKDFAYKAKHQK